MALEAIRAAVDGADFSDKYDSPFTPPPDLIPNARKELADVEALLSLLESEKPYLGGEIGRLVRKIMGEKT